MFKKLVLKVLEEQLDDGQAVPFAYTSVIGQILRAPGTQGLTVGEMADRIGVLRKLAEPKTDDDGMSYILLTEDERRELAGALETFPFNRLYMGAVALREDIRNAPEVEIKAA